MDDKQISYLNKRDKELYEQYKNIDSFEARIIITLLEEKADESFFAHCREKQ